MSRWEYAVSNPFAAWLGFASVLGSSIYFLVPGALVSSSIGLTLGGLEYVWNAMFFISGVAMLSGIWFVRPRWEVVGKCLACAALAINSVAVVSTFGWRGTPNALILASLAAACAVRVWSLVKAADSVRAWNGE